MDWWFFCTVALVHEGHTCPRHVILEKILSGSSEDECCSGDHDMTNNQRDDIHHQTSTGNSRSVFPEAHSFRGFWGMPPPPLRKILEFRTSEMASAGLSGQVNVAKIIHISSIQEAVAKIIHISSIQEALLLLFSSQESSC